MSVRPNRKSEPVWVGFLGWKSQYKPLPFEETARAVTKHDARFLAACMAAGIEPTIRQARKYLARRGRWASAAQVA